MTNRNLIVLEGLDGCGKQTQTELLCQRIQREGKAVRHISFPNYTDSSSSLVQSYLAGEFGSAPSDVNAYAASSFYAVDRYAAYKKYWRGDYLAGVNIVADRYTTSNAVYQMTKLPQESYDEYIQWLEHYEYDLLELPPPNRVVFLDMPPEISRRLISRRYCGDESREDIHEMNLSFQSQCRNSALYAAQKLGWSVVSCSGGDALRPIGDISDDIWQLVRDSLI